MGARHQGGRNIWVLFGELTAVAWEFLGSILAGALLGYFADRYLAFSPWGLIVCTLLGSCSGLYRMVLILRRLERRSNEE
jgi:F0F1-type ATP synthase assembly protein I